MRKNKVTQTVTVDKKGNITVRTKGCVVDDAGTSRKINIKEKIPAPEVARRYEAQQNRQALGYDYDVDVE